MTATDKLVRRIVRTPGVCGGQPRIEGHRIRVRDIVMWFEALRMSADEIADEYGLSLSDIYLALAYYHANQKELREEWETDDTQVELLMKKYPSRLKAYQKGGKA